MSLWPRCSIMRKQFSNSIKSQPKQYKYVSMKNKINSKKVSSASLMKAAMNKTFCSWIESSCIDSEAQYSHWNDSIQLIEKNNATSNIVQDEFQQIASTQTRNVRVWITMIKMTVVMMSSERPTRKVVVDFFNFFLW